MSLHFFFFFFTPSNIFFASVHTLVCARPPILRMQGATSMVAPSSYYPSECSACGKNRLAASHAVILAEWQKETTTRRDAMIQAINSKAISLDQMACMDSEFAGISNDAWIKAGILSNCCKLEILSYIPLDLFQRDFNDANRTLPPDFDQDAVVRETVQSQAVLDSPLIFRTIGTNVQYES